MKTTILFDGRPYMAALTRPLSQVEADALAAEVRRALERGESPETACRAALEKVGKGASQNA